MMTSLAGASSCLICGKLGNLFLGKHSYSLTSSQSVPSDEPPYRESSGVSISSDEVFQKWSQACSSSISKLFEWKASTETEALKHVLERSTYCKLCIHMIREVSWVYREKELLIMRMLALKAKLMKKLSSCYQILDEFEATETFEGLSDEKRMYKIWNKILERNPENASVMHEDQCFVATKTSHIDTEPQTLIDLTPNTILSETENVPKRKSKIRKTRALPQTEANDNLTDTLFNPIIVKVDGKCKSQSIKCTEEFCERLFLSNETMEIHIKKDHEGCELPFNCTLCNKSFATKGAYGIHMMRHETPSFICELCGRQFTVKRDLKDHITRMHSSRPAYSCKLCSLPLVSRENLEQHESQHESEKEFPFICVICRKTHANSTDLQMHVVETHISNVLRCDQCGKTFWAMESLRKHLLTHKDRNPKFSCSECGYVAPSQSKLKDHMRKHSVERHLACQVCGSTFKYKKSLSRHMRGHNDETPYKCAICGKGFRDMQKKKRHEEIHSGNKYSCQLCSKEFNAQQNLQQHLRVVHTPKDPNELKKSRVAVPKNKTTENNDGHLLPPPKSKTVKKRKKENAQINNTTFNEVPEKRTKMSKVLNKTGKTSKRKSARKKDHNTITTTLALQENEPTMILDEPESFPATTTLSFIDSVPLQEVEVTFQDASGFELISAIPNPNVTNTIKFEAYAPIHQDETLNYHQGVHHIAVIQHDNSSGIPVPVTISEIQGLQIVNAVVTDNNFYFQ